jgi:hypothetical protein
MILTFLLSLPFLLWLFYLAVMSLARARDAGAISIVAYRLGLPVLYFGLVLDVATNVLFASVLFLEFPHEWTVSARLTRLAGPGIGWRSSLARWIGTNLLNDFDTRGPHIRW